MMKAKQTIPFNPVYSITLLLMLLYTYSTIYAQPNMVSVIGGTFTMGCTIEQEADCYDSEKPAHEVYLQSFEIGRYEVTQTDWQDLMSDINHAGYCGSEFDTFLARFLDNLTIINISTIPSNNTYTLSFTISGGIGPYTIGGITLTGNTYSYVYPCNLFYDVTVFDSVGDSVNIVGPSPGGCTPSINALWCTTAIEVSCDTIIIGTTTGEVNDISY